MTVARRAAAWAESALSALSWDRRCPPLLTLPLSPSSNGPSHPLHRSDPLPLVCIRRLSALGSGRSFSSALIAPV